MSHPHLPPAAPSDPVQQADLAIARPLVPHAERWPLRALKMVGDLSDQEPLYAAAVSVILVGLGLGEQRLVRTGTQMLAAHLLATALRGMVKQSVDRTRPIAAARRGIYRVGEGRHATSDFNSFPSGHTAGALAVALTVADRHHSARGAALGLAGAAAGAQILCSRHFVSDVVAGAAIGWAAAALIGGMIRRSEAF